MITKFDVGDHVLIAGEVIAITVSGRGESYRVRTDSGLSTDVRAEDVFFMEEEEDASRGESQ